MDRGDRDQRGATYVTLTNTLDNLVVRKPTAAERESLLRLLSREPDGDDLAQAFGLKS